MTGADVHTAGRETVDGPVLERSDVTIAVVQLRNRPDRVEERRAAIEAWVARAAEAGADLVVLPELSHSANVPNAASWELGEPLDGPSVRHACAFGPARLRGRRAGRLGGGGAAVAVPAPGALAGGEGGGRPAGAIGRVLRGAVAPPRPGRRAALLRGAVAHAAAHGAVALEAYPIDKPGRGHDTFMWNGARSMFAREGFVEVARRRPERPVMRRALGAGGADRG